MVKRSHLVLLLSAIFLACGLGVIVATVALSPTFGTGNGTEALVPMNIKGGCAGCVPLNNQGASVISLHPLTPAILVNLVALICLVI